MNNINELVVLSAYRSVWGHETLVAERAPENYSPRDPELSRGGRSAYIFDVWRASESQTFFQHYHDPSITSYLAGAGHAIEIHHAVGVSPSKTPERREAL